MFNMSKISSCISSLTVLLSASEIPGWVSRLHMAPCEATAFAQNYDVDCQKPSKLIHLEQFGQPLVPRAGGGAWLGRPKPQHGSSSQLWRRLGARLAGLGHGRKAKARVAMGVGCRDPRVARLQPQTRLGSSDGSNPIAWRPAQELGRRLVIALSTTTWAAII